MTGVIKEEKRRNGRRGKKVVKTIRGGRGEKNKNKLGGERR